MSKLHFSFCPGPVTQTDWTGVYGGFFRSVREECSKIYNRNETDKLSNISKDTRNCPMGFSMKAGMVQNPASSILWFCIRDGRILLKTCQALSFDVLLFDPPAALWVKNFFWFMIYVCTGFLSPFVLVSALSLSLMLVLDVLYLMHKDKSVFSLLLYILGCWTNPAS